MTAAGVSPITIAQMLGHSSTQIVPRYAQVLDQNRLDAVRKMESYRQVLIANGSTSAVVHASESATKPAEGTKLGRG
jgi:hypothetical protein